MVAKRRQRPPASEWERVKAVLDSVPVVDDNPEDFWGPNFKQTLNEAEADTAAGRTRIFYGDEEFLAALEQLDRDHADA